MRSWLVRATDRKVVHSAWVSALVVGPLLIAINHGDALLHGDLSWPRLLRMALTFLVPYCVSTFSSVQARRFDTSASVSSNQRTDAPAGPRTPAS